MDHGEGFQIPNRPNQQLRPAYSTNFIKYEEKSCQTLDMPMPPLRTAYSTNFVIDPEKAYQTSDTSFPQLRTPYPDNRPIKYIDLTHTRQPGYSTRIVAFLVDMEAKGKETRSLTIEITTAGDRWERIKKRISIKQQPVLSHALDNLALQFRRLQTLFDQEECLSSIQSTEELDKLWLNIIEPITAVTQLISEVMFRNHAKLDVYKIDGIALARSLHFVAQEISYTAQQVDQLLGHVARKWTERTVTHMDFIAEKWRVFTIKRVNLDKSNKNIQIEPNQRGLPCSHSAPDLTIACDNNLGKSQNMDDNTLGRRQNMDNNNLGRSQNMDDNNLGRRQNMDNNNLGRSQNMDDNKFGRRQHMDDNNLGRSQNMDNNNLERGRNMDANRRYGGHGPPPSGNINRGRDPGPTPTGAYSTNRDEDLSPRPPANNSAYNTNRDNGLAAPQSRNMRSNSPFVPRAYATVGPSRGRSYASVAATFREAGLPTAPNRSPPELPKGHSNGPEANGSAAPVIRKNEFLAFRNTFPPESSRGRDNKQAAAVMKNNGSTTVLDSFQLNSSKDQKKESAAEATKKNGSRRFLGSLRSKVSIGWKKEPAPEEEDEDIFFWDMVKQ